MPTTPRPLDELNALSQEQFVGHVGPVYENSPWIAWKTWAQRPFASFDDLRAKLAATVHAAGPEAELALIQAHPDLAGRLARIGALRGDSREEQQSAGLDRLTPEEVAAFDHFNGAYQERFGFPFVICARLNDRQMILDGFRRRLLHTRDEEIATALAEIYKIAGLRLAQIVRD